MFFKPGPLENKTYLVVDDYGDMRSMIKNMLIACGAKDITLAVNGAEALACMASQRFDVVLCDYNLGSDKDGQQVLEEAKHRHLIGLGTVFLMVTAENAREMVMGAVEYQPDSYLTKPFNKDLLNARLEKLIVKKQDLLEIEQAIEKHEYTRAINILDLKIAQSPPNSNELRKIKGEICLSSGNTKQAREVYETVLSIRDIPWACLGLSKTLFLEKNYTEAQSHLQTLIEHHPNYTASYDWLAKTYKALNQLNEAQATLQTATEISPKVVLRQKMLGEIALLNDDMKVAEAAFTKAVQYGRHSVYKHPSNYSNLAKVTAITQQGEAGLKVLKNMKREFSKDTQAPLYMATAESMIHETMGDHEAANASLQQAADIFETLDHRLSSDCAIEMAKTFNKFNMTDKATELLQNTVLNNHTDESLLDEIKLTMVSMDMKEDVLGSIDAIRQEVASLNKTGIELARNGKLEEAVTLLKQTAERMPANKVVNLNTALVLLMDMERNNLSTEGIDEIQIYLKRVSRTDPNNKTLQKLKDRLETAIKTPKQEA
ncbi:MAG: tetratricopeptide repeat protein [Candidatus Thiodiazotropha sp. (ex Lucinoma borealis)]|nr:tetratricopeptide repeat protein [Candidatus Thiodiazotropha sp. (ex Lucinoma borealis)]MCU7869943.1 tetratricopeptide repeat protein [Candidatus Thiodiazotropha sp. (ex Lucinoma borealis)]